MVTHKVSVPDDKVVEYKDKIDKDVQVLVKAFANKGKIVYYGI